MRDLAKSIFRFSWAMSMLGLEQIETLVGRKRAGERKDRLKSDFDRVSSAAEERFGQRAKTIFESGDRLQSEFVDAVFDVFEPESKTTKNVVDRMADVVERSAEVLREVAGKDEEKDKDTKAEGQDKKS